MSPNRCSARTALALEFRDERGVGWCVLLRRIGCALVLRNGSVDAEQLARLDAPLTEVVARTAQTPGFDGAQYAALQIEPSQGDVGGSQGQSADRARRGHNHPNYDLGLISDSGILGRASEP